MLTLNYSRVMACTSLAGVVYYPVRQVLVIKGQKSRVWTPLNEQDYSSDSAVSQAGQALRNITLLYSSNHETVDTHEPEQRHPIKPVTLLTLAKFRSPQSPEI